MEVEWFFNYVLKKITRPIPFDMFDRHTARTSKIIQSHCPFFASILYYTNCGLRSKYGVTKRMQNYYLYLIVEAWYTDEDLYWHINNDPRINVESFFKELNNVRKASEKVNKNAFCSKLIRRISYKWILIR